MSDPRYVLGVDSGATHTRALVLDEEGRRLGAGESEGANPLVHGFTAVVERIVEAARQASEAAGLGLAYFDAACFGLAGIGREKDRQRVQEALNGATLAGVFELDHDAAVAWYGATEGEPGVIVVAGTGAMAFGVDAGGHRVRADGWGRLLGDEGSGYDLGVAALRATARTQEGRGPRTAIAPRVFACTGTQSLDGLASWLYDKNRSQHELARLAQCVLDAAAESDEVAQELVAEAGNKLAATAAAVVSRLDLGGGPALISYGGSLLTHETPLTEAFLSAVGRRLPGAVVQPPRHPPVVGAALRALTLLPGES